MEKEIERIIRHWVVAPGEGKYTDYEIGIVKATSELAALFEREISKLTVENEILHRDNKRHLVTIVKLEAETAERGGEILALRELCEDLFDALCSGTWEQDQRLPELTKRVEMVERSEIPEKRPEIEKAKETAE